VPASVFGVRMKRFSVYIFLIVSFSLAAARAHPLDAGSQAQADAFLAQARTLITAGDLARAGEMAASALDLAPTYSEALYMAARVESGDRPSTRKAIEHVRSALTNTTWNGTDPGEAEQLLTGLLIRTGQLAEARKSAERLAALRPDDPRGAALLAQALERAGNLAAAQRTLADALRRFHGNDELRLSSARLLNQQGRSAEASALIRTGLQLHPESQPLLLASAGLEIDRAKMVASVDLYLSKGGTNPLGPVLGMEAVAVGKRRSYLDQFISMGGLSRQDLVGRAMDAAKGSSDLTARLRDALLAYTGNRDLDADLDGFWEDRWVFDAGKVVRWIHEPAQDGVPQYEAVFADGRPVSLASRDAAGNLTRLTYSRYPFLEKAELHGEGTLVIVPYTMQCVFLRPDFATGPQGMAPRIAAKLTIPGADALRKGSYQHEEFAADGVTPVRRTDLAAGQPVFMEESTAGDGVYDHRVWYTRGQPERGTRSLSHDGIFQVTETWKNGRLAAEVVDTDGDGTPDYRETYGASPVKSWDFNEDGRDDSREYDQPDGSHVRELSTKMDGTFDLKIIARGPRIVSFTRRGAPVPVVPDDPRGVTWIGHPAPAAGKPDLTLADGLQTIEGLQYLVFRLAGIVYVEAVQE
jgi:tetratricopeptide (TPR) repeat protein